MTNLATSLLFTTYAYANIGRRWSCDKCLPLNWKSSNFCKFVILFVDIFLVQILDTSVMWFFFVQNAWKKRLVTRLQYFAHRSFVGERQKTCLILFMNYWFDNIIIKFIKHTPHNARKKTLWIAYKCEIIVFIVFAR